MLWSGINRVARALGRGAVGNPEPTVVALTEDYGFLAGRQPAPARVFSFTCSPDAGRYPSALVIPGVDREIRVQGAYAASNSASTSVRHSISVLRESLSGTADHSKGTAYLFGDPSILELGENAPPGSLGTIRAGATTFGNPQESLVAAFSASALQAPSPTTHGFIMKLSRASLDVDNYENFPAIPYPAYYFAVQSGDRLLIQGETAGQGMNGFILFHEVAKSGL